MKITNVHGLPETIARALVKQEAQYNAGPVDSSVTDLIKPARISFLTKKHRKEMTRDLADNFWALLGSGVHHLLEMGATENMVVEERLYMSIDGWRISGAIDCQEYVSDIEVDITDYKVTSCYSVLDQEPKEDWVAQLNLQALLLEANKPVRVRNLTICAVLRDWSSTKARLDPMYPQAPVVLVPIPVWSKHKQLDYARARIADHREARFADVLGYPLQECSPTDRWVKGESWAVKKSGNKRAVKIFDNPVDAEELKESKGKGYIVEYREGQSTRCGYCGVSQWCDQFAAMHSKDEDDERSDPVPPESDAEAEGEDAGGNA